MKKIVLLLVAVVCGSVVCISADDNIGAEHRKPIVIITQRGGTSIDRTIAPSASASFEVLSNTIEVHLNSINSGNVYIVDESDIVIESAPVFAGMSSLTIPAPTTPGNYALVIDCSNYYGEGYFTIEQLYAQIE